MWWPTRANIEFFSCSQDAANGREMGAAIVKPALANMMMLLLWRLQSLATVESPDDGEIESLDAARSAFSGQLDAIFTATELVCTLLAAPVTSTAPKTLPGAHLESALLDISCSSPLPMRSALPDGLASHVAPRRCHSAS